MCCVHPHLHVYVYVADCEAGGCCCFHSFTEFRDGNVVVRVSLEFAVELFPALPDDSGVRETVLRFVGEDRAAAIITEYDLCGLKLRIPGTLDRCCMGREDDILTPSKTWTDYRDFFNGNPTVLDAASEDYIPAARPLFFERPVFNVGDDDDMPSGDPDIVFEFIDPASCTDESPCAPFFAGSAVRLGWASPLSLVVVALALLELLRA